jgi:glycosyltransferase involved in cell wall biosynthesis
MKISVVIPGYDTAACIRGALDSALAQSYPAHEIIVVDDGSSDDTAAIVSSYGDRARLIRQAHAGVSVARNRGVAAATGEWIAFLDADDVFWPHKLALQKAAVDADPRLRLVYGAARMVRGGRELRRIKTFPSTKLWPALRYRSPILPSTVLLRRDSFLAVGGFDASLRVAEDWDLWLKLVHAYSPAVFHGVDEVLSDYTIVEGSLSSDPMRLFETKMGMIEERLLRGTRALERLRWRRKILAFFHIDAAIALRELGDPRSFELAARSLLDWPFPSEVLPLRRYAVLASMLGSRLRGRGATSRPPLEGQYGAPDSGAGRARPAGEGRARRG